MKRVLGAALLLCVAAVAAYLILNRTDGEAGRAPAIAGAPATAESLVRGEYLIKAADCVACHTAPGGKAFAGGLAFRLPFGTIYSSNITADRKTGIGAWNDDQFVRAVREGVDDDGEHLYPTMPYLAYTHLSRGDVLAIKAYLFALPAVKQENRANDLNFPFNQRWAMGVWNAAFFKSQRFAADASKSPQWNSGAYLATALGHCPECHTPRNFGYGLQKGQDLTGEELQGWRAYNITPDIAQGIGSWSDADLIAYFKSGHAPGRASAAGPMGEAVAHSLQFLNDEDAAALSIYLRSVPARKGAHPIAVNSKPEPALASSNSMPGKDGTLAQAKGLRLFEGACASCHQWNGEGQQSPYASLLGTRGVNDIDGTNVTQAILQGVDMRVGGNHVYMPAFGSAYSDSEVAALANYVIAQFGGKDGKVTPDDVARRRSL
jgi:mono/diheme cytochrome c family protein